MPFDPCKILMCTNRYSSRPIRRLRFLWQMRRRNCLMCSLVVGLLVKSKEVEWRGCLSISLKYHYWYIFFSREKKIFGCIVDYLWKLVRNVGNRNVDRRWDGEDIFHSPLIGRHKSWLGDTKPRPGAHPPIHPSTHPPTLIAQYTSWEIQCSLLIVNNSVNNTHTFSTD